MTLGLALLAAALAAGHARAHVTPPVRLASEREAVSRLLGGADRITVREVRLSAAERSAIERRSGWRPGAEPQRVHLGRDRDGRLLRAALLLTEHGIHGPVRVAVGLGPDGRVTGAAVLEVSEETYPWVRPLLEQDFLADYVGEDAGGRFTLSDRVTRAITGEMPRFYGNLLAGLVRRAALVFETGILAREPGR